MLALKPQRPGMSLRELERAGLFNRCCMHVLPRSRSEEPRYCGKPGAIRCEAHRGRAQ